ncbi:MAG: aspartate/glutamate racemase family protein [Candidatus Bathyarchaeia archaeon]
MRKIAFLMASASTGDLSGELERRQGILRDIASPGTAIDIYGLEEDTSKSHLGTIQSQYEAALSTPEDIACAIEAERAEYQAVIIPCGGDPGVAPLREVLNIPVVPPGSTAKHICSLIGPRFSVLTSGKGGTRLLEIHEKDGLLKHVSIHPIGLSVPEIRVKREELLKALLEEGRKAVEEHGAASLTYGCMSIGFQMLDKKLEEALHVPAINPVKTAVRVAEMLIDLKISHSKLTFPYPPNFSDK